MANSSAEVPNAQGIDRMTAAKVMEKMIQKFEETGSFHVHSSRRRKKVNSEVVEEVATAVQIAEYGQQIIVLQLNQYQKSMWGADLRHLLS
ncbi:hypothetical protein TNCV_2191591 [Trichonephila clavipes]|nr:hypothetical protein TNCV_2191591 [Trichonephila clavipes]